MSQEQRKTDVGLAARKRVDDWIRMLTEFVQFASALSILCFVLFAFTFARFYGLLSIGMWCFLMATGGMFLLGICCLVKAIALTSDKGKRKL